MVKKRGIQQRGLDLVFGTEPIKAEALELAQDRKNIILYLREGLNPANRDFTKYPNEIHKVMRERLKEESEGILYMYMWWQSWGFGRNFCRTSYLTIEKDTLIGSKKTAQRAMNGLVNKRFVVKGRDEENERDVTQGGSLYRVFAPCEITEGVTEEGVIIDEIPEEGVVMLAMAKMTTPSESSGNVGTNESNDTIAKMANGQNGHSGIPKMTIAKMTIPSVNKDSKRLKANLSQNDYSQNDHPLKDRLFKDSLSIQEIISLFYSGIGQEKIPKAKRESAEKNFQKLLGEGFEPEDIKFAVEWTLKNVKEKMYDFSIVCHTIGEAMAAKEKEESENKRKVEQQKMEDEKKAEEERQERERIKLEEYKAGLSEPEKKKLRERAMEKISEENYSKEYINPQLISFHENKILKKELSK